MNAVWESADSRAHIRMTPIVQWSSHIRKNAAFYIMFSVWGGMQFSSAATSLLEGGVREEDIPRVPIMRNRSPVSNSPSL